MAWLPSHQELRSHPKLRKAARRAGCSTVQMIGHLHLLWWWALDHAPDGDVSRFDNDDLALAAEWEDDPDVFVDALNQCGSGGGAGFVDGGMLHDWDEYGGKYGKRVAAAKKAAAARWADADAMPTHSERNADALPMQSERNAVRNAEERRGEESTNPKERPAPDGADEPAVPEEALTLARQFAEMVKANGHPLPRKGSTASGRWLEAADRLLRIGPPGDTDGVDPPTLAEALRVARWATGDKFWRANIRSLPKFREQWSTLALQAAGDSDGVSEFAGTVDLTRRSA